MFLSRVTEREAGFAPDLRKLGFKPTNDGKFVSLRDNKSFFDFFFSSKTRSNQVRKGVMQEAVRAEILRKLRDDYGIVEVSIGSKYMPSDLLLHADTFTGGGRTVLATKPTGRHVTILSNPVSELIQKREVIILVGDSGVSSGGAADSSVFSWRTVLEKGGLYKGSAVGLADQIMKYGQSKRNEPYEKDGFVDAGSTITAEALGKKDEPVRLRSPVRFNSFADVAGPDSRSDHSESWPAPLLALRKQVHDNGILGCAQASRW